MTRVDGRASAAESFVIHPPICVAGRDLFPIDALFDVNRTRAVPPAFLSFSCRFFSPGLSRCGVSDGFVPRRGRPKEWLHRRELSYDTLVESGRRGEDTSLHGDPRPSAGGRDPAEDRPSAVANAIGHINDRADAPQPATGIHPSQHASPQPVTGHVPTLAGGRGGRRARR
jgi:hypothetical protein